MLQLHAEIVHRWIERLLVATAGRNRPTNLSCYFTSVHDDAFDLLPGLRFEEYAER